MGRIQLTALQSILARLLPRPWSVLARVASVPRLSAVRLQMSGAAVCSGRWLPAQPGRRRLLLRQVVAQVLDVPVVALVRNPRQRTWMVSVLALSAFSVALLLLLLLLLPLPCLHWW